MANTSRSEFPPVKKIAPKRKLRSVASTPAKPKPGTVKGTKALDKVVRNFDGAVEKLREYLPELQADEMRRDRLRRLRSLAGDGILDNLQRFAMALEGIGPESLHESIRQYHRSARMALDRICRTFEIEAVHRPGDCLAITEQQAKKFEWSGDDVDAAWPARAEVLRSGWKCGSEVFVLPKVRIIPPQ